MTNALVQDEIARVHAQENYSEFENYMMAEIMSWQLNQEKKFGSTKEMVNAFWSERLN